MSGTGNEKNIEVVLLDETIHVHPSEGLPGIGTPMTQEPSFEMLQLKRFCEEWVVAKIKHAQT